MSEFSTEDIKRKIAGLLAKAERTDNEAEQKAFSEKAEKWMLRLGISRAEAESAGQVKAEDIIEVRHTWRTIYAPAMGTFAYSVGRAYGNLTFLQSRWAKDHVTTYIIGHKSDVEQFQMLLNSLHQQVFSAMKAFRKANRDDRRWNTIHENFVIDRSFVEGYGYAVARRLHEMRKTEEKTASPGAALVLVGKQDKVEAWKNERYPSLRNARASNRQQSWAGREAGARAGRNANLGNKGLGGTTKAVRS